MARQSATSVSYFRQARAFVQGLLEHGVVASGDGALAHHEQLREPPQVKGWLLAPLRWHKSPQARTGRL
jgi:hypothetical protein